MEFLALWRRRLTGLLCFGLPRCCFDHDCCYEKAEKAGCAPKMQTYTWECENNRAKCGESHPLPRC